MDTEKGPPPARGGANPLEAAAAAAPPLQAGAAAAAPTNTMPPPATPMAAALAQQADPAGCTLEVGSLASPTSKLRVQIFRVNHLTKTLRLDEEDRALQETLRPLAFQEEGQQVTIESVGAVSFSAIRQHMDRFKPHCVHFMGHGTEERLVLVDDGGQSRRHGAAEIATLFSTQPQCFLAVFNCCLSAPIARAVCEQGGVFATIGTSMKIGDSAALAFATALWGSVLLKPLGAAFTQARLSGPYHLFQRHNPPSPTQGSPPPAQAAPAAHLPQLQAMLREQYTSAAFINIRILDYEANTAIQLEEIYTRLAIVDAKAQQVREAGEKKIASRADLALEYDTLYSPKQPSHIDHLFGKDGEPTSKRVLVAGRAGIGKTTLSRKIAHLWATGHPPLTSRFDLVFRIPLRGDLPATESMAELLHVVCLGSPRAFTLAQLDAALQQAGPRVLLLLDGYDEFRAETCPLLHRLIEGKLNPGFSVLITSRPAAAQQLMRNAAHHPFFTFDSVFELLGFSTAAITEYVGKYFAAKPDTAARMVAYLEAHPTVQGAARVPIVAALLCILYESHEERGEEAGELPSTLTGIFQEMVEYLLGRARLRLELKGDGDDEARLQAGLEFLQALAWEGMQQGRILFPRGQLEAFSKPPHSVERATLELALELGFLTTAESRRANERVAHVEYHFLHLTLQEFLAARHLQRTGQLHGTRRRGTLLSSHSKVEVFEARASLRMVWQFGCGLLGADAGDLLRTIVHKAKSTLLRRRRDKRQALLALQCQAESGCLELVGLLEGVFKDGRIDLGNTQLSAVELAAVVDVVKRFKIRALDLSGNSGLGASDADVLGPALRGARAPEEVCVSGCGVAFIAQLVHVGSEHLRATDVEMRIAQAWEPGQATLDLSEQQLGPRAGAVLADVLRGNTTLVSLNLTYNFLVSEVWAALAEALKSNSTLTSLNVSRNKLGTEGGVALAQALKGNTTVTSLNLSCTALKRIGGAAVSHALMGNTILTALDLSRNKLGPEGGVALAAALKGNTSLTNLDLGNNNLGLEGGAALAEALQGNTTLTSLDLYHNNLGTDGGAAVAEALKGNTTLTNLGLSWNELGPEGGAALAEALKGNTTLTILDLGNNRMGTPGGALNVASLGDHDVFGNYTGPGGTILAEALSGNTTLIRLDLSWNSLGPRASLELSQMLKGNTTLTILDLNNNKLGAAGGAALAEALKGNTTLTILDLSDNQLGPEGGAALTEALKGNTTLTDLGLGWNQLGPASGAALAEALMGNTSLTGLTSLTLHGNRLGPKGGLALAEALRRNALLSTLDLSSNDLGPEGGAALAKALRFRATLTSLNLSDNKLGSEGGAALAEALRSNTTLTSLDLSDNNLGPAGGAALAEALKHVVKTTLTSLDLSGDHLGSKARAALRKAAWSELDLSL